MIWDSKTVLILWGYSPVTRPAIKWNQTSNGNWESVDRGFAQDSFESDVTFTGSRSALQDLETVLDDNRNAFTATFGDGEEVFGMDLDYSSSYSITVTDYGNISQVGFDKWNMKLHLKLFSPVFLSVTGSLSKLRMGSFDSDQGSTFDITKQFSYTQTPFYTDRQTDPGKFKANFTQTSKEMKEIRRYLLSTNRTSAFTFPSFPSVTTPFGFRMGTGPFNTKIIKWEESGRSNFTDWNIRLTFARDI